MIIIGRGMIIMQLSPHVDLAGDGIRDERCPKLSEPLDAVSDRSHERIQLRGLSLKKAGNLYLLTFGRNRDDRTLQIPDVDAPDRCPLCPSIQR